MGRGLRSDIPIGLICGGGPLPAIVAGSAAAAGRRPVVVCISGEADPAAFGEGEAHLVRWGEFGRLFRILAEAGCRQAAFIGSISRRPSLRDFRLDLPAAAIAPRIVRALGRGDDGTLRVAADIFSERGVDLVSPLVLAPALAAPQGHLAGPRPRRGDRSDIALAAEAARTLGALDIGQAAVAVGGRVVAVEGAEGTDSLLARVAELKRIGRITAKGGVLVKCMKPHQDPRLDIPTIGAETAERAAAADLAGAAVEAGRCLIVERAATAAAFSGRGLFLAGLPPPVDADPRR